MTRGRDPNLSEKLAATLLALTRLDPETGLLVPLVDWEAARSMTVKEIIGLFEFDHWPVPAALGGSNHPSNLVPLLETSGEHLKKTTTKDIPEIAKSKRLNKEHEEFRRRMLAKVDPAVADEIPQKQKSKKPLSRFKRTVGYRRANGEIVPSRLVERAEDRR